MNNLDRAANLADTAQYEASIARSLIVIAAALKMQVEASDANAVIRAYEEGYKDGQFDRDKEKEQAFLPLLNEEEATKLHQDWCEDPNCNPSNNETHYG